MNNWKKYGLTAALAACVGLAGAGVVTYAENSNANNNVVLGSLLSDSGTEEAAVAIPETGSSGTGTEMSIADVAEEVMPSMVAITSTTVEEVQNYYNNYGSYFDDIYGGLFGYGYGFGNGRGRNGYGNNGGDEDNTITSESRGTGVIVANTDDSILIATNAHVVDGASELSVAFIDETAAEAELLGADTGDDLAVIKVAKSELSDETLNAIKVVKFGSSDSLRVGEEVVAIGNALGYGQSVSHGIVSALNRRITTSDDSTNQTSESGPMIQTDASINPGNSGGALLNMKGELIGINSAKYESTAVEGMGYAIPIDFASPILTSLANGEEVFSNKERFLDDDGNVMLGVTCFTLDDDTIASMKEQYGDEYNFDDMPKGVMVQSVQSGSPADRAGIEAGDIILELNGTEIKTVDEVKEALKGLKEGDTVDIKVAREARAAFETESTYQTGTLQITFGMAQEETESTDTAESDAEFAA
ncbi:MAG: trypsin-like peptidase domain-containing protein [Lachnospiraceae bacterium]|nr:trypsin-like peptidase domain-containing protein [Lachnospiraceae bacterium]